jgi:hypothetical protein
MPNLQIIYNLQMYNHVFDENDEKDNAETVEKNVCRLGPSSEDEDHNSDSNVEDISKILVTPDHHE